MNFHEQDPTAPDSPQREHSARASPEPEGPTEPSPPEPGFVVPEYQVAPVTEIPEDLRVPWGWTELLVFVAATFGLTILLRTLLLGVFAMFHVTQAQLWTSVATKGLFAVINQILLSFALLGYLAAQVRLQYRLPFWRTIGWRQLKTRLAPPALAYGGLICGGFMLSVVVQFASSAIGTNGKLPIEVFFESRETALLLILAGIFVAPVVEETIFRGYIYPVVARTFGVTTGVIATGIVFGLLHAPQLGRAWGQVALLVVVGIVFTYARAVTRTVAASYLLHLSYNLVIALETFAVTHGLRTLPPN